MAGSSSAVAKVVEVREFDETDLGVHRGPVTRGGLDDKDGGQESSEQTAEQPARRLSASRGGRFPPDHLPQLGVPSWSR